MKITKKNEGIAAFVSHRFEAECYDEFGNLKWKDNFTNLVTIAGLNKYLDAALVSGLTSPVWYIGLVNGPGSGVTYSSGDIMSSHIGWAQNTSYSESTRQIWIPGTITNGSVSNVTSKAVFTMNGSVILAGCFITDSSTKAGTTGTLLGVGNFSGGDRSAVLNDKIYVTITVIMLAS